MLNDFTWLNVTCENNVFIQVLPIYYILSIFHKI